MKAQMFIVTTIFLVALVFAVQQTLLQGFAIDLSSSIQDDDFYMIESIKTAFSSALDKGLTCAEIQKLVDFIMAQAPKTGFSVSIDMKKGSSPSTSAECNPANTPSNIIIRLTIKGRGIETNIVFICNSSECSET